MISVLIPVYNTSVNNLVSVLYQQILNLPVEAEIIVVDDASDNAYKLKNHVIKHLSYVSYIELSQNIGRLKIRKLLADYANFEWLIFLDADSKIIRDDFLLQYVTATTFPSDVIIGGRGYQNEKPSECAKMLHWKYGKEREDILNRKTGFLSNNFCVRKELFQQLHFNIPLKGYGHEDTLIGIQLEEKNARINYVENRVLHEGVEEATMFMRKSIEALNNLALLSKHYKESTISRHVKLYNVYWKLRKWKLTGLIQLVQKILLKRLERNLTSCNPSLKLFDLYRLGHFVRHQEKMER